MGKGLVNICSNSGLIGQELAKYLLFIIDKHVKGTGKQAAAPNPITEIDVVWTGELDRPVLRLTAASDEVVDNLLKAGNESFPNIPEKFKRFLAERSNVKINFYSSYDRYYKQNSLYTRAQKEFRESKLKEAHLVNTITPVVNKFLQEHTGISEAHAKNAHAAYAIDEAETLWWAGLPESQVCKIFHTHGFSRNPLMSTTFREVKGHYDKMRRFEFLECSPKQIKQHIDSLLRADALDNVSDFRNWLTSEDGMDVSPVSSQSSQLSQFSQSPVGSPSESQTLSSISASTSSDSDEDSNSPRDNKMQVEPTKYPLGSPKKARQQGHASAAAGPGDSVSMTDEDSSRNNKMQVEPTKSSHGSPKKMKQQQQGLVLSYSVDSDNGDGMAIDRMHVEAPEKMKKKNSGSLNLDPNLLLLADLLAEQSVEKAKAENNPELAKYYGNFYGGFFGVVVPQQQGVSSQQNQGVVVNNVMLANTPAAASTVLSPAANVTMELTSTIRPSK